MKVFLALLMIAATMASSAEAFEDGDWQLWNTESVQGALSDDLKIKFEEEFRLGGDIGELYYHHTDIGLSQSIASWLSAGVSYRQVYELKGDDWVEENRPHVNTSFNWKFGNVKVEDRVRFEYRMKDGSDAVWRYRNKASIKLGLGPVSPYLADEVFFDPEDNEVNRNRLYIGAGGKLWKVIAGDLFLMLQSSKKNEEWKTYNVLGIKLKVGF